MCICINGGSWSSGIHGIYSPERTTYNNTFLEVVNGGGNRTYFSGYSASASYPRGTDIPTIVDSSPSGLGGTRYCYFDKGNSYYPTSPWNGNSNWVYQQGSPVNVYGAANQANGVRIKASVNAGVICDGGVSFLGNNAWSMSK